MTQTIQIDYNTCLDINNCKHRVNYYNNNIFTHTNLLSGVEIVSLVINNNLQPNYQQFKHFEHYFNGWHKAYEFLENIKNNL